MKRFICGRPAYTLVWFIRGMKYMYSYEALWEPKGYPVTFRMYQLNLNAEPDWVYMGYWNTRPKHFIEENV